jgi:uncharacterized protein YjbI with pentapeptide repeats
MRLPRWTVVPLALAALLLIVTAVALLPALIVSADVVTDSTKRLELQNQVRTSLLQGIGGIAILGGAYFTWRQLQLSREQFRHSLDISTAELQLSREAQLTERFSSATEQLGHGEPRVRVGAIYALEQLAKNSTTLRPVIHELLSAYLRAESPWSQHDPDTLTAIYPDADPDRTSPPTTSLLNVRAPDLQAAIAALGRRIRVNREVIDLQGVDLRGASLVHADISGIDFGRAMLAWAHLTGADLCGANLTRANLFRAKLRNADLRGAVLGYAVLWKADLSGADLTDADLTHADLRDARCDEATRWPEGYDWQGSGVFASHLEHP